MDIAKDRLYVSAPSDRRRRSCQTVLALIVENLAGAIAPVLCHMAEDIWQNLPYSVPEDSVFERGWPKVPAIWRDQSLIKPMNQLREFRTVVNRVLEDCRSNSQIGAGLQAAVRFDPSENSMIESLRWLADKGDDGVDCLRDWLLVSQLQIGGESWAEVLVSQDTEIGLIDVSIARGKKCERCWHFSLDVGSNNLYKDICGRCIDVIDRL